MTAAFTLAHLSDVHLAPLPPFGMADWRVKRLLGFANWQRSRKFVHLRPVLDRLVEDLQAHRPDHIAVTGDLVNIGLPQEHARALAWLQSLGAPDKVTVVPGNHDIYVRMRAGDHGVMHWNAYMDSNSAGAPLAGAPTASFPFVRRFGDIALIGVNSAVPTPPFMARGRVGQEQLQRLGEVLERARRKSLIRVLLIHHPPLPGQAPPARALADAGALARLVTEQGVELILHGHNHTNTVAHLLSPRGAIPVVGITSASIGRSHKAEPLGRYNLYRFTTSDHSSSIEMVGRGLSRVDSSVVELERRRLESPRPRRDENSAGWR